jgi:hypothetical protein
MFLSLHFENILTNQNMLSSHILCWNETKIQYIHINQKIEMHVFKKLRFCHVKMDIEHHNYKLVPYILNNVNWKKI